MVDYLSVAIEAAKIAGEYQTDRFGEVTEHDYKSPGNPVSEVDRRSETLIAERISSSFPDHAILSEESGMAGDHEITWVVDPLDGTSNYLRGLPQFTVSIGMSVGGKTELGVVYQPIGDRLFAASDRSQEPDEAVALGVSDRNSIDHSLVAIPYSSRNKNRDRVWETHRYLGGRAEGIRSSGSGALDLANLASGVTDIVYAFDQSQWDRTAGRFLIEAAGGIVTGHSGETAPSGDFIASNEELHPQATAIE
jgi:myo-inositol-1(or 4)-monophosphatase